MNTNNLIESNIDVKIDRLHVIQEEGQRMDEEFNDNDIGNSNNIGGNGMLNTESKVDVTN